MNTPRISASSYSNTAPLIWSFLYGAQHGSVELILDNAPARSAELLSQDRVGAALVPVITFQQLADVRLIPDVCVGAKNSVRSVCLLTRGVELADVRSVALDVSSKTSVVLAKIIFREFLGFEPKWMAAEPDIDAMLNAADCALLIGDPALRINAECGMRNAEFENAAVDYFPSSDGQTNSALRITQYAFQSFDLAELWNRYTGLGFVFAMWMTKLDEIKIDFAGARDEGLERVEEIAVNYSSDIGLTADELTRYLSENISYSVDASMQAGLELYFKLAGKCGLIDDVRPLRYLE